MPPSARLVLVYAQGVNWRRWRVDMPPGWRATSTGTDLTSGKRDMLFEGGHAMRSAAAATIATRLRQLQREEVVSWYEMRVQ